MTLPVTAITAALLTLWLTVLSLRVIALRGNPIFAFFAFGRERPGVLERAIRGHGNLTEYAPIFICLMLLAELGGAPTGRLVLLASMFGVGRLMHGTAFCFTGPNLVLRIGGMVCTLTALSTLSLSLLLQVV